MSQVADLRDADQRVYAPPLEPLLRRAYRVGWEGGAR